MYPRPNITVLSAVLLLLGCAAVRTVAQSNCTSVDRVRIQLQWVLQAQFAGTLYVSSNQVLIVDSK
jgi:hypothetical protein